MQQGRMYTGQLEYRIIEKRLELDFDTFIGFVMYIILGFFSDIV